MVLVFLGLGCVFVFTDLWIEKYPRPTRNYIGYVLAGWGVFRAISVVMKYRNLKRDDDNEE